MPVRLLSNLRRALLLRGGIVSNSVLISVLLVVVTSAAVATVVVQQIGYQVEQATDRRLIDGTTHFQALLDDTHRDLQAAGEWLSHDSRFREAIRQRDAEGMRESLNLALGLQTVREALVTDADGRILSAARTGQPQEGEETAISRGRAFRSALDGETAHGFFRGPEGQLRQGVYVPVLLPFSGIPNAVLRLSSFPDMDALDRFHERTGLEASLFFGDARLVTTLRNPDGTPMSQVGPEPAVYQKVVGDGKSLLAWRDLPMGRVRSFYTPLTGSSGERAGMLSVSVPLSAVQGETRDAVLPVLPITLAIIAGSIALAYLLARRVREPILTLAGAAARLQSGDLVTPIPPIREPELMPLAEQLEMARSSVKARMETIASAEARQREVFAALGQPIITTLANGRITGFNRATVDLLGESTPYLGCHIQEVLPFLDRPAQAVLPLPGSHPVEDPSTISYCRIEGEAGRLIDLEVIRTRLAGEHLPPTDVYVLHDVSRHAELNRFREQLLYSVAHELRSPLTVLDNAVEMLATDYEEMSTGEFDRLMRLASRTVSRLRGLMEDLLSAGNIQSGRFQVHAVPARLSEVLGEALDELLPGVESRVQRVECSLEPPDVVVLADPRYLRRALINLLANASKYGPRGSTIRVGAVMRDGRVRVSVEDEGPGIPPDQLAGVFERFYRVRANHEEPGVGLGLAIVKGIIEAHDGGIGVESEVGRGTTVWFTLPLAAGVDEVAE